MESFFKTIGDVVSNAVVKQCTFYNDTEYQVMVVDHDGTRALDPGCSEGNYLVSGFSLDLVMKFPGSKEEKITFSSNDFGNRTHRMSVIFRNKISAFEDSRRQIQPARLKIDENSEGDISLKSLRLLKWTDSYGQPQTFRLVNRVSAEWKKFGTILGLEANQLQGWKEESLGNVETCWLKVMEEWLTGFSRNYPATWEGLYSLLIDCEFSETASELEKAVEMCQTCS